MSLGIVFLSEVFGTAMLTLLGCGVVANVALRGTKGNSGGFLMVTWGWGVAVFAGVYRGREIGGTPEPRRDAWPADGRETAVCAGRSR
jgi:glycerol uptake facilitator protein